MDHYQLAFSFSGLTYHLNSRFSKYISRVLRFAHLTSVYVVKWIVYFLIELLIAKKAVAKNLKLL